MTAPGNPQITGTSTVATTSLTSATYTVGAGANKRLVVALHLYSPSSATLPSSVTVTHNGVAMTLLLTSQSNNANGGFTSESSLYLFDLVLGSTTPSGAVVATWVGGNTLGTLATFTLFDVVQTGTPVTASSQSLGPDSVATSATDVVIDLAANDSQKVAGNFYIFQNTGQTQLGYQRSGPGTTSEGSLGTSYANAPGAGTTSMGWGASTVSAGPRSQHIVAAYGSLAPPLPPLRTMLGVGL